MPKSTGSRPEMAGANDVQPERMIWRYMDLAKYVCLLKHGMFFAQASEFLDQWEGAWAQHDVQEFRTRHTAIREQPKVARRWGRRYKAKRKNLLNVGVSCWHLSSLENPALWALYVPRGLGVAVQSTVESVQDALAASARPITSREIKYVNYYQTKIGNDPLDLLSHKRNEFASEQEFRFLLKFRLDETREMACQIRDRDTWKVHHVPTGAVRPMMMTGSVRLVSDQTDALQARVTPSGVHLQVDLTKLIHKVYLGPQTPWHVRRAVVAVTEAFGLSPTVVVDTVMDRTPPDRLEFHYIPESDEEMTAWRARYKPKPSARLPRR